MQKLITALVKAKGEFTSIQKDRTNPHYKSKYATLDAVLDAVTPALCNHGLAIVQSTATDSGKTELKTFLYHESGEHIVSSYPLPDIMDAQKLGAALTYARRYALCALLSVTADEDDDGNTAKGQQPTKERPTNSLPQPSTNNQAKAINDAQIKRLWAIARNTGYTDAATKILIESFGVGSSKDIKTKDYDAICEKAASEEMAALYNAKIVTPV